MQVQTNAYQIKFKAEDFIKKGVVDLQRYHSSKTKIMLVLKGIIPKTNGLIEHFGETMGMDCKDSALNRLGFICWSIQHGFSCWTELIGRTDFVDVKEVLGSIAYVSVPKFRDCSVYRKVAVKEKYQKLTPVLNEHIEIYQPDVVMFCGTYNLFNERLSLMHRASSQGGENSSYNVVRRIFINAADPEIRSSDFKYYEGIRNVFEQPSAT